MRVLRALTVATALVFPAVIASCASESDEFFGQGSTSSGTGGSGGGAVGGSSYGGFYNEGGDNGGGNPGVGGTGGTPSTTSNMSTTSGSPTSSSGGGTPCQTLIDCLGSGCLGIPSCDNGFCECQGFDGGFDLDGGLPDLGFP